jgi:predicted AlkP superfamily phosphohydrolase/phosphomutase
MSRNKIILIGLEMMEASLVEKWGNEGYLPTLAGLRKRGAYRKMFTPSEISSSSTWPSINCGVTPGKHGIGFVHRQFSSGTYETQKKRADEVGRPVFWEGLKRVGKRIFTMDVPDTMVYGVNGVEIVGWGLDYKTWDVCSNPPGLIKKLFKEFGTHPLDGWYQTKEATAEAWFDIKEKLLWATRTRTAIIKKILKEQEFDFTMVVYSETHFAGHLLWHINNPEHPDYNPEFEKKAGQPIFEIYQEIDRGIKEIVELDPEATYIVFSNSGVGPNFSGRHFVGEVLARLGYRGSESEEKKKKKKSWLPAGDVFAVQRIEKIVGQRNIEKIRMFFPEKLWDTVTRKFLAMGSDWKDSVAFDIPSDYTGTVRINLKGREPKGKVDPKDYDALCEKIAAEFRELKDPDTGQPLVSEIVFPHKKYPGDHMMDFPDIVIKWVNAAHITAMASPKVGEIRIPDIPDARTGAHNDVGFFLAVGNDVRHDEGEQPQIYVWDFAPTILRYMGLPIPDDMDGEPIDDIFQNAGGGQ